MNCQRIINYRKNFHWFFPFKIYVLDVCSIQGYSVGGWVEGGGQDVHEKKAIQNVYLDN